MANPASLKSFVKGYDARRNAKGRPRKLASTLKGAYSKAEIDATLLAMVTLTLDELKVFYEADDATILERAVANALRTALKKGDFSILDRILNRVLGAPTQTVANPDGSPVAGSKTIVNHWVIKDMTGGVTPPDIDV